MKVVKNTSKIIYLLTIALLLCVFAFIATAKVNYSKADMVDEAENIIIKSAQISVQTADEEWAVVFKAEIDLTSYNAITNNGASNVKFGMLIGPTKKIAGVVDYNSAILNKFVAFCHVGTSSSGAQTVNFGSSNVYNYYAGIVYNNEYLLENDLSLRDVAMLELTAIPFYSASGENYLVLKNQKSCLPRNILVESYIQAQAQGLNSISSDTVNQYAGNVQEVDGEFYICSATNRLLWANTKGADLNATSLQLAESDELYIAGKKQPNKNTAEIDSELVEKLSVGKSYGITIYTADNTILNRTAKVVSRVIMRFSDDGSYPDGSYASDMNDYLVKKEGTRYNSIFSVTEGISWFYGTVNENQRVPTSAVDGIYVLGNNIYPTTRITHYNAVEYNQQYYPVAGVGFVGTFDGRGNNIYTRNSNPLKADVEKLDYSLVGLFPTISGGTIKNLGCVFHTVGDYYKQTVFFSSALNATFENIYVKVENVTDYGNRYNVPILGSMEKCTIKNFVIDANYLDVNVEGPQSDLLGSGQQYNGLVSILTHNNRYPALADVFANNTATNFYSVGTSILHVQQETNSDYSITAKAVYLVNPDSVLAGSNSTYKKASSLSGEALEEFNYYARLATIHKKFMHTASVAEEFLASNPLQIKFISKQGFYSMQNARQMKEHILANVQDRLSFSGADGNDCWYVNPVTGDVLWSNPV